MAFMEIVCAIARGDPGYRGRHVGVKLRAAMFTLEQLIGKATQPVEHKGSVTLEQLVRESMSGPGHDPG